MAQCEFVNVAGATLEPSTDAEEVDREIANGARRGGVRVSETLGDNEGRWKDRRDTSLASTWVMKRLHVCLVYNAYAPPGPEAADDRAGTADLRKMIRHMARALRTLGHTVTVLPLAHDLFGFQRKLRRLQPDVVFNQYDDVVHGALYEMRLAALVRMMGYPITGSPALALGLCRYKFMTASLLMGAGIPIPPNTALLETVSAVDQHKWHFPIIVQASQEHAGIGLERDSVVHSKNALKLKVREILKNYSQPALAQHFLPGREFNVGVIGGNRLRVLPLAEVDYQELPPEIPPIMSYAAKWVESSVEYQNTSVICPADVDPELARKISTVTLQAFRAVSGWGYGRVDIRLDEEGEPRVLEVNCNPCLDEDMGLARCAAAAGITYPQLLQHTLRAALEGPPFDVNVPMFVPHQGLAGNGNGKVSHRALVGAGSPSAN